MVTKHLHKYSKLKQLKQEKWNTTAKLESNNSQFNLIYKYANKRRSYQTQLHTKIQQIEFEFIVRTTEEDAEKKSN